MKIRLLAIALGTCLLALAPGVRSQTAGYDERAESNKCIECHDEEDLPDMSLTPHAGIGRKKPPMKAAAEAMRGRPMADPFDPRSPTCVGCHGLSEKHVKVPKDTKERPKPDRNFSKSGGLPAHERSAVCLTCHQRDSSQARWSGSQHDSADVACSSCHRVHTNRDKTLVKASQADTCYGCHKEQRAQVQRPSHHPVPEGKMTCSDCHNPHGSIGPKLAKRDSTNDTCYTCHAEKRGPYVHEHEPVREDCASCHNPHGSTVAGLLKARAPMLCLQCHTPHVNAGVGAIGGQRGVLTPGNGLPPVVTGTSNGKNVINFWQGRSCANCHTQVHGSNNPSVTNPTPNLLLR